MCRKRKQALQTDLLDRQSTMEQENASLTQMLSDREAEIVLLRHQVAMMQGMQPGNAAQHRPGNMPHNTGAPLHDCLPHGTEVFMDAE